MIVSNSFDVADLPAHIEMEGAEYFFNNYVDRNTKLTFDSEASMVIPTVDRKALEVAFEGAKRFYHTAESYSNEVFDILEKYGLN